MSDRKKLIEIIELKKYFPYGKRNIYAVNGVSFSIKEGECFGLVGESGCGKTTLAKTILRLIEPNEGMIYYKDIDISKISQKLMRNFRKEMVFVFQNPFDSLNPVMTVRENICRGIKIHRIASKGEITERAIRLLESLHLNREHLYRFPHEFSGGQRQRIAIARCLAMEPKFMVLDEPTSALDVSVQAQILKLLAEIKEEKALAYLFITHNLAVVRILCDRIGIMYLGKIMEINNTRDLFTKPVHPYTKALLSAIPILGGKKSESKIEFKGEIPDPSTPPPGCRFNTRCLEKMEICGHEEPPLTEVEDGHMVACFKAY